MARVERGDLHLLEFASRMVVMAFVRATCSRGGSVCKDWFDRAGLMLHWLTRNVLSVSDFTWSREGMELVMQDGSVEQEALRGEVCLNRVKHHHLEGGYEYDMSLTADAVQQLRRATTWVWFYQMSRGLFRVQYVGMSCLRTQDNRNCPKIRVAGARAIARSSSHYITRGRRNRGAL